MWPGCAGLAVKCDIDLFNVQRLVKNRGRPVELSFQEFAGPCCLAGQLRFERTSERQMETVLMRAGMTLFSLAVGCGALAASIYASWRIAAAGYESHGYKARWPSRHTLHLPPVRGTSRSARTVV